MSRAAPPGELTRSHSYAIAGVACVVSAPPALLARIDDTYGAFGDQLPAGVEAVALTLAARGAGYVLTDSEGHAEGWASHEEALVGTLNRLVELIVGRLADRGVYAIHAASLADRNGGVVISGRSGSGKTTLALGLVRRGLRILSDEFALSAPDGRTILPYRRGLHIRPGTPELIPELGFLTARPRHQLGGGSEWALGPGELEQAFPGCLGEAVPLRHVVLLEDRTPAGAGQLEPVPAALAAVELLRAIPAAVGNFDGALKRMAVLLDGTRCARLHPGELTTSVELLLEWLAADA